MGRGPSYPYVGLEEAIGQARKIYDYAKRGSAPVDSVVTDAFKYSPTSSSAGKMLAALKSFGLIEDQPGSSGKSLKLTQRAIRILLDDQDSEERKEEIRKAALAPKWYEYCWKKWGKDMPPAMRSNLLIEHGFVDSTVEGFLRDYRRTVAFAGLLDDVRFGKNQKGGTEGFEEKPKVGDYVQWEVDGILKMPTAKKLSHFSEDGQFAFLEGSGTGIPAEELIAADPSENLEVPEPKTPVIKSIVQQVGVKMLAETVTLADGITLQVQWPATITLDAFEDFEYQLEGFKKRVRRAIEKPQPELDEDENRD